MFYSFLISSLLAQSNPMISLKYHESLGEMLNLASALDEYKTDCGRYPNTEEGLENLLNLRLAVKTCPSWKGPYIDDLKKDAFGRPYLYESDGDQYLILTYGSDKKEGGGIAEYDLALTSGGVKRIVRKKPTRDKPVDQY